MGVERFIGVDGRDAMRKVRERLGDDALILSNRPVEGGIEIVAMADETHQGLTAEEPAAPAEPGREAPPQDAPGEATAAQMQAFNARLMDELASMRELIHSRMAEPAPAPVAPAATFDPATRLRQRLVGVGFSQALVRELIELLPPELAEGDDQARETALESWIERQLAARLTTLEDEAAFLAGGGVFALIGPTGVGKTTSTAKLAARYVMAHGNRDAALVASDSYRIAAREQLRVYAGLLGVEVHAPEEGELGTLLERLITPRRALLPMQRATPKRTILIDTLGMSQRDSRLASEVARLAETDTAIRPILVLNAASHGDTLEQVVAVYCRAVAEAGLALAGCIVTKLDESARPATVLDILARHRLPLIYTASGQRVPEDLDAADVEALVREALATPATSPFGYDEASLAEMAGRGGESKSRALSRDVVHQGRALAAMFDTLQKRATGTGLLVQQWQRGRRGEDQASFAARLGERAQQAALAERRDEVALWWPREKSLKGTDRAMPLISLDDQGLPLPLAWLRHRLPASPQARLDWAQTQHGAAWHLMATLPDSDAMQRLADQRCLWIAAASASRRLRHGGERQRMIDLAPLATALEPRQCRWRGRPVTLALSWLPALHEERRGRGEPAEVMAWFATLHDVDDNRELARRYWLSNVLTGRDVASRLACALALEGLETTTRRTLERLGERGVARHDRELQLATAAALASLATRLELCVEPWAMDVRAQLFNLAGGSRKRSAANLLDALIGALEARDALSDATP